MSLETEEEILMTIRRVLAGERDEFRLLVERFYAPVFALAARQLGDREAAQEVTQETFLRAYRYLNTFSARSQFFTWLTRIALNRIHSYAQSAIHRNRGSFKNLTEAEESKLADNQSADQRQKDTLSELRLAVLTLKPKYREVVTLCSLERMSYQEAARVLEIPVGTVCSRMNTALNLLRNTLRRNAA